MVLVLAAAAIALAGCLRSEITIHVRPDGSGEVIERFTVKHDIAQMLAEIAAMTGDTEFSLADEDELREKAQAMGEDVAFVSVEPLAGSWGEGYEVRYRFEDINTLRVDQNPSDNLPVNDNEPSVYEYLTFGFEHGDPATLTVHLPQPEDVVSEAEDPPSPQEIEAAAQHYEDMLIQVRIELAGTLVDTDAEYYTANSVTLLDLDFNRILANPELSRAVFTNQAASLAEIRELTGDSGGFEVESKDRVTVRFR